MTSPADEFAEMLQTYGHGTIASSVGWNIAVGRENGEQNTVITCYDTGAFSDADPRYMRDFPTVQIRVRGNVGDYAGAFLKQEQIKETLIGRTAESVGTALYVGIYLLSDILSLGYDDNNRPIIVSNWRSVRELPAAGQRE